MRSVVHLVTTGNFAGVERYVCTAASETAARGWRTAVVGGNAERMRAALRPDVRWLPGATAAESLGSLARVGRQDICHVHMTVAEAIAVATRPLHRAAIVSTRHFPAARGSSRAGRLLAPWISKRLTRQIAVSEFVARRLERPPDAVIRNGVPPSPCLWREANRVVLVLQRLEAEKDTLTALRAWKASRLADEGWSLRVVGEGSERTALEMWAASERVPGIVFSGWTPHVSEELGAAGIFLAPGPIDSFGLGVVEAMAAGVPVVACAAGGHLETVGRLPNASMFAPGDTDAAAAALRSLLPEKSRSALSDAGRRLVEDEFTTVRHVDQLLAEYEAALSPGDRAPNRYRGTPGIGAVERSSPRRARRRPGGTAMPDIPPNDALHELVVCSLEAWDEVWRRNQFFTDALLRGNPALRVLYVEPAADPLHDLANGRRPSRPSARTVTPDGRLVALRPLKPLPRRIGGLADASLLRQALHGARRMGFTRPVLWINDVTYAALIERTGWPSLYDVTDDWLLAPFAPRELERLRRFDALALAEADEVVVCSPSLAESRGAVRSVTLIPNGVDVEHFRRPRPRPADLPFAPTAVYIGTLHESRLDVRLVAEIARGLPHLQVVLVGPDALGPGSRALFAQWPNIHLLGPRPYVDVPAYLQHADVVIVPHLVTPFTESLDPIKAYECRAIDTPTIATPVAGFRDLNGSIHAVERRFFAARIEKLLNGEGQSGHGSVREEISWEAGAARFEATLLATLSRRP